MTRHAVLHEEVPFLVCTCAYGQDMKSGHAFTIGRTVLLVALLAALMTWLRVGDDEGDGAVILPLLALPVGAFVGYFVGLAINRE